MNVYIWAFASVFLVSLVSFAGLFTLTLKKDWIKKISLFLVSLAVGALLGDAVIHLIPESFEILGLSPKTSLLILSGLLVFFILEKFIRWRHCHVADSDHVHPIVAMNLIGDGLHNFIDGMLIAATFQVEIKLGFATTFAILLHEIPQEIADFGVLVHGGLSPLRALFLNFLSGLVALLGVALVFAVPQSLELSHSLMAITAGCFLYIAGSDLVPELHHHVAFQDSLMQFFAILLGIIMMYALTFIH